MLQARSFLGRNMGSPSPKTNKDLVSSPQLHFNFYFYVQEEKGRFFFFVGVIICNFFRTRKAMYKVQKVIEISSQLGSIEEFCKFVDSFHSITKYTEPNCHIGNLGPKLKKKSRPPQEFFCKILCGKLECILVYVQTSAKRKIKFRKN